jgi:hypothetical protein
MSISVDFTLMCIHSIYTYLSALGSWPANVRYGSIITRPYIHPVTIQDRFMQNARFVISFHTQYPK